MLKRFCQKNDRMTAEITSDEDDETFLAKRRAFVMKNAEIMMTLAATQHGMTVEEYMKENGLDYSLEEFARRMYDDADPDQQDNRGVAEQARYRIADGKIYIVDDLNADAFDDLDEESRDRAFTYYLYEFDDNGNMVWTKTNKKTGLAEIPCALVKNA